MAGNLDKDRLNIQQFISHNFYQAYQAHVDHFADLLIGCKSDEDQHWMAAFGMSKGRWVVFTANNLVLNAFHKLNLNPHVISKANPDLLPNHGINWGHYYETKPQVMFIKVPTHI